MKAEWEQCSSGHRVVGFGPVCMPLYGPCSFGISDLDAHKGVYQVFVFFFFSSKRPQLARFYYVIFCLPSFSPRI